MNSFSLYGLWTILDDGDGVDDDDGVKMRTMIMKGMMMMMMMRFDEPSFCSSLPFARSVSVADSKLSVMAANHMQHLANKKQNKKTCNT